MAPLLPVTPQSGTTTSHQATRTSSAITGSTHGTLNITESPSSSDMNTSSLPYTPETVDTTYSSIIQGTPQPLPPTPRHIIPPIVQPEQTISGPAGIVALRAVNGIPNETYIAPTRRPTPMPRTEAPSAAPATTTITQRPMQDPTATTSSFK